MDQETIIQFVVETFVGVEVLRPTEGPGAGDTFFIYDPEGNLAAQQRFPFATIVTKDYGDFDNTSKLDRPGVFRLNIGVSRETFRTLFGPPAVTAGVDRTGYDFAAMNQLMPHPVYAPQSFVCILNPEPQMLETIKPLLAEAYSIVTARLARRA